MLFFPHCFRLGEALGHAMLPFVSVCLSVGSLTFDHACV